MFTEQSSLCLGQTKPSIDYDSDTEQAVAVETPKTDSCPCASLIKLSTIPCHLLDRMLDARLYCVVLDKHHGVGLAVW